MIPGVRESSWFSQVASLFILESAEEVLKISGNDPAVLQAWRRFSYHFCYVLFIGTSRRSCKVKNTEARLPFIFHVFQIMRMITMQRVIVVRAISLSTLDLERCS
jgi:hypothetical protein